MPQSTRVFRVFVSSTFSDMAEERNALQERVFPRLQDLCLQHGARFQDIDLRWGISAEAGLNQRATDLCLQEIVRCQQVTQRPNFIVLMGDRYGWQPLPDDIPVNEWDILVSRIVHSDDRALFDKWYKRDDNAVPPVYVLQPRQGKYIDQGCWNAVEAALRQILLSALAGLEWSYGQRLKYETSVTEQEIVAGIFNYPHAKEAAFCFFRSIDDLPHDANDEQAVIKLGKYIDLQKQSADKASIDQNAQRQLADLKARLQNHIPNNITTYRACWTGDGITVAHLDTLCEDVYYALSSAILAEATAFEVLGQFSVEQTVHTAFMKEHIKHFVGRTEVLSRIENYLDLHVGKAKAFPFSAVKQSPLDRLLGRKKKSSQEEEKQQFSTLNLPLVLHGPSGIGKSTVMARAIAQTREMYRQAEIFYRFIGVTPDSSNILSLLKSLCHMIAERYGDNGDIPQEYEALLKSLPDYLKLVCSERPLIIFLDALDLLQNTYSPSDLRCYRDNCPQMLD